MQQFLRTCALVLPLGLLSDPPSPQPVVQGQNLCEELEFLSAFLGDWTGHFDDPGEQMEIHESWTAILNGHAIHRTRTVPEAEQFEAEAVYFVDRAAATIRFVVVTNNGYVNRGVVAYDGDTYTQTGEQIAPDSSTRTTTAAYRFRNDDTVIEEGGHTIIFVRNRPD